MINSAAQDLIVVDKSKLSLRNTPLRNVEAMCGSKDLKKPFKTYDEERLVMSQN